MHRQAGIINVALLEPGCFSGFTLRAWLLPWGTRSIPVHGSGWMGTQRRNTATLFHAWRSQTQPGKDLIAVVKGDLCRAGTTEHRRHGSGATGSPSSTDRAPCLSRCPGHGLQKASLPLPPRNEVSTASSASSPQIPCITISLPRSTRCQRSPERGTELLTLPRISSRAVITLSSGHRDVLIVSSTAPGALLKPPRGCLYRAAWLNLTARRSLAGGPRGRDRKAKTPQRTGTGRLRAGQARRGFMQGII